MKVDFWKPSREYDDLKPETDKAIQGCLERGELVLGFGEEITNFEEAFKNYLGAKHCIMTGSGTHSLYLAYKAINIENKEVITTSHTFIATINQIVAAGGKPVLADIGDDGLIDPDEIERLITPQTKAIVPVHLEGKVCDMDRIMEIAEKHRLIVIEDACQAIGAKWKDDYAGTIGHIGCFSFHPAKVLGTVGNAGAVVCKDSSIAHKIDMHRQHYLVGKGGDRSALWGGNFKPDPIHAAVLNVRLPHLNKRLERRLEVALIYDHNFKDLPIDLPVRQGGRIYQDYVIRTKSDAERDQLANYLKENGVGILGHDITPNHHYPNLGLNQNLQKTSSYLHKQIRLPCNPFLTDKEVNHVVETMLGFYANKE